VELSLVDLRWQMVLDCMGAVEPPFSQGGLQASVRPGDTKRRRRECGHGSIDSNSRAEIAKAGPGSRTPPATAAHETATASPIP
jgi:hypothetical protein